MVHTLELSKVITQESFESLITSCKGLKFNGFTFYTRAYETTGIPMFCLRKFKPKRKNDKGEYVILDSEPYIYMVVLSINTGIMFGGDGYLSNNVLSFTPDFAKAIYDKIFEQFPELELFPEYREQGYKKLWNTGKSPEILKMYYDINSFKLRRIDYTFDILTSPEQYMQLLECGKSIRRKSFERQYFDDEVDDLIEEDVDNLVEDDEPDFDDIQELFDEYSSDTKYIYIKSNSVNINIYLKGEQFKKENLISPYNTSYNFLRIEFQIKKSKLNALNQKHGISGRTFHKMPIPEYESEILSYYINQLTGTGLYVTHDRAKKIIDSSNCTYKQKEKLKKVLFLIAQNHGVKRFLEKVENGTITELGKLSTVLSYIREIQKLGINPVTISRNMKNSIADSELINILTGNIISECALPNLVDIVNSYNEQLENEQQQGRNILDDELNKIDDIQ